MLGKTQEQINAEVGSWIKEEEQKNSEIDKESYYDWIAWYFSEEELNERCKNEKFCVACLCNRDNVKVDEYHVCEECRNGSSGIGMPRRLPVVTLNSKNYFRDDRLREFRNVNNPVDRIAF